MRTLEAAVTEFDSNDITVADVVAPYIAQLDRDQLLALREAPTVESAARARELLAGLKSALLLEHFVARTYEQAGAHEQALEARLDALVICPRYDSWLSGLLLARIAATLLQLGRAREALPLVERSLRFMPLDPRALAVLAAVRAACGDAKGAARVRAYLFDAGVRPDLLPGTPTDEDRAAEPYETDLGKLEPISDEEVGRALVLFREDAALDSTLANGRRLLATQLRFGDIDIARATAAYYEDGSPISTEIANWLALDMGWNEEYLATEALRRAIDARFVKLRTVGKSKSKPKPAELFKDHPGARIAALRQLSKEGAPVPRGILLDLMWGTAYEARKALPDDPIVVAAAAAEQAVTYASPVFAGTPRTDVVSLQLGYASGHSIEITYPAPRVSIAPPAAFEWWPVIEVAEDARAKCAKCRAKIEKGQQRFAVRHSLGPIVTQYFHVACADKKTAEVATRSRRPVA
jgi:tetratricopeptide (TPR) repeat protein